MDEFHKTHQWRHRIFRHDLETLGSVEKKFGSQYGRGVARNLCLIHIIDDAISHFEKQCGTVLICVICEYAWKPRVERPIRFPNCKSRNWDGKLLRGFVLGNTYEDFIKPEFLGMKKNTVDFSDRTRVVRFFMKIFKKKRYGSEDIARVNRFLNKFSLTKAEKHAIIFHLGYKYGTYHGHKKRSNIGYMKIDGYYDINPESEGKKESVPREFTLC